MPSVLRMILQLHPLVLHEPMLAAAQRYGSAAAERAKLNLPLDARVGR